TEPVPIHLNTGDTVAAGIAIGLPEVNTIVEPLSNIIMDKVAIKGCTLPFVIIIPFNIPAIAPMKIAAKSDNQIFTPDESIFAATAPENPRIEPTDRSIPDVNITKVIPAAIIALMEVCLNTFNRFAVVKNFGL